MFPIYMHPVHNLLDIHSDNLAQKYMPPVLLYRICTVYEIILFTCAVFVLSLYDGFTCGRKAENL